MRIKRCRCSKVSRNTDKGLVILTPSNEMLNVLHETGVWNKLRKDVAVDRCLATEIQSLWKLGIVTTSCCCGHNDSKLPPYIAVLGRNVKDMEEWGYVHYFNPIIPDADCFFYPKSVKMTIFDYFIEKWWRLKYKIKKLWKS